MAQRPLSRGDLVCDKADERHVGQIEQITWRTFGKLGHVKVRWLETGWLSTCEPQHLRRVKGSYPAINECKVLRQAVVGER